MLLYVDFNFDILTTYNCRFNDRVIGDMDREKRIMVLEAELFTLNHRVDLEVSIIMIR